MCTRPIEKVYHQHCSPLSHPPPFPSQFRFSHFMFFMLYPSSSSPPSTHEHASHALACEIAWRRQREAGLYAKFRADRGVYPWYHGSLLNYHRNVRTGFVAPLNYPPRLLNNPHPLQWFSTQSCPRSFVWLNFFYSQSTSIENFTLNFLNQLRRNNNVDKNYRLRNAQSFVRLKYLFVETYLKVSLISFIIVILINCWEN